MSPAEEGFSHRASLEQSAARGSVTGSVGQVSITHVGTDPVTGYSKHGGGFAHPDTDSTDPIPIEMGRSAAASFLRG